ncbi:MAG: hypothetical protein RMJ43_16010 [Chloroherpetonaceae bacterium]|nr:hypothetical protein [Chthonomonadaceae bacterium]MDW8209339.1 hypothetical protein [Chloroherpetonaceae bacterium]
MPLVFVHGVAVRQSGTTQEQQAVEARNAALRHIAFADQVRPPAHLHIENPGWGDLGATFAWNLASVPTHHLSPAPETLPPPDAGWLALSAPPRSLPNAATSRHPLLTLARTTSLAHATDIAFAAAMTSPPAPGHSDALALLAARTIAYADANPRPAWLRHVRSDSTFLKRLVHEAIQWQNPQETGTGATERATTCPEESLTAARDWLQAGVQQLAQNWNTLWRHLQDHASNRIGDLSRPLIGALRPAATTAIGRFLGDVLVYLDERGTPEHPGPIVRRILDAIETALQHRTAGDNRLYLMGHSMGGNILYDILTAYRPDIPCDLLITVGSQVGLLEELKIFKSSNPNIGADRTIRRVPRPPGVAHWINLFDPNDVLGFGTEGIFADVTDCALDIDTLPLLSHNLYFQRPRFYARLRAHINGALHTTRPAQEETLAPWHSGHRNNAGKASQKLAD